MPADFGPDPLIIDAAADFLVRRFLLNEQQRKRLVEMDAKKKAARAKRIAVKKERIRVEEMRLSKVDRYVFGYTGEQIVANQDRMFLASKRQAYKEFQEEYQDEIALQMVYIARRFPWYKYSDDVDKAIRRKAERELWNEVKDDFEPEYDFHTTMKGLIE